MKKKILSILFALVLVVSFSLVTAVPAAAVETSSVFQSGGARLVETQNDDGGWDWPLDDGNPAIGSETNIHGPIGIGLAQASLKTNDPAMYAALEKTGTFLLAKTDTFTCWDGYLAFQLDSIFGGTSYTDYVKANFYDKLATGTYVRKSVTYDTEGYITAAGYAWDLGIGLISATSVSIDQSEIDKWIAGVKGAIDGLDDINDPYYPSDLAGGLYGLAYAGETEFSGTVGGKNMTSVADLADEMASLQMPSGVFREGMELAQDTAYALLALNEFDASSYMDNITRAAAYLENAQLETGGWLNGEDDTDPNGWVENNEMTAEALWALAYAPVRVTIGETGFYSIQAAINSASPEATINVAAGTYYENVTIDESVTIQGAGVGSTIVDGGDSDRVFLIGSVDPSVIVTISGMTIQNGSAEDMGGGVVSGAGIRNEATLTLNNCTVTSNTAAIYGGGITNVGTMTIDQCTISGNTATGLAGTPMGGVGGGIFNAPEATLTMTNSTISGNTASAATSGGDGGGIMNGLAGPGGVLTMTNCTVSGNTAGSAGGGIGSGWTKDTPGGVTLTNVTITDNEVTGGNNKGGGIYIYGGIHVVKNTIVAGNTASDADPNIMKSSCTWTASNCITSGDPLLGSLQDNGGSTETHALLLGSPAIDTGDDSVCPATDQRGVPRPQGPASSDIGSYEVPYTVYVDDDWTGPEDCGGYVWGANAFAIIEDGINPVAEGGTVDVAAGTYNEAITIDKGLTLEGAQAGEDPTVEGARTDPAKESTIQGSGGTVVTISADVVVIDGFTITNPSGKHGIYAIDQSNITITNNIVTDVGSSDISASGSNYGIKFRSLNAAVDAITIAYNQVSYIEGGNNKSGQGIVIGDSNGDLDVTNLLIQDNVISNITSDTVLWGDGGRVAIGILLNHGTGTTGKTVDAQVLDNTITNLEGFCAHGIGLEGNTPGAVVERNDISNLIDHKSYLEDIPDAVAVQVEDNASADTVGIHFNNFSNVLLGVWNKTPSNPEVDATNNWWGKATGPYHATANPGITAKMGDAVSENVDFSPWLYKTQESIVPTKEPAYAQAVVLDNAGLYGWNTFSTPIVLDDSADTWAELVDVNLTDLDYSIAYRFDLATQEFVLLTDPSDDAITPGEGFFIKMNTAGSLPILYSTAENLYLPSRPLTVGFNLIGLASLEDMLVENALFSLAGEGQVVSPTGNESPGAVLAGDTIYVGEAYWAYMLSEETLVGFTTTPVNWVP